MYTLIYTHTEAYNHAPLPAYLYLISLYAYNNSDNNHHNHDGMPDIMATI